MGDREWIWDIEEGREMRALLTDVGLQYYGYDWISQSGGGYMAGFQSADEFLADGGINGMSAETQAAIRAVLIERPAGASVRIRVAGETPQQAHLQLDGAALMLSGTDTLFEGLLPHGPHRIEGVLIYAGVDSKGRRVMQTFAREFMVPDETDLLITRFEPRWPD